MSLRNVAWALALAFACLLPLAGSLGCKENSGSTGGGGGGGGGESTNTTNN